MRDVVIAGAVRTPIGKFGGGLAALSAAELGAAAAREALRRAGVSASAVDELAFGCARQAGGGPNVARQVAYRSGLPARFPRTRSTWPAAAASRRSTSAYRAVRDGDAEVVLAGGTESMSRVPYFLTGARWGYRMGAPEGRRRDVPGRLPLPAGREGHGGDRGDAWPRRYGISREEQDAFALRSQQRAAPGPGGRALRRRDRGREGARQKGEERSSRRTSIRAPTPPSPPWPSSRPCSRRRGGR